MGEEPLNETLERPLPQGVIDSRPSLRCLNGSAIWNGWKNEEALLVRVLWLPRPTTLAFGFYRRLCGSESH
jgi:hypothetical protein